ncbi:MAG TPA: DUF302 domain-containing protein [Planctomycetota bacterium]|jgi:uncharacterized protein (DUF302 family)
MLHIVESNSSIQAIEKSLPEAAARHKFGVLGVHNLKQKMNDKGVPFERECLVFEVCSPVQAKKVLDRNIQISTLLPCRISVYSDAGRTKLATILPTAMIAMFPNPELEPVAREVETDIKDIMREAASPK